MSHTFQAIRDFDKLNHKAVLMFLASSDLWAFNHAIEGMSSEVLYATPSETPWQLAVMRYIADRELLLAIKAVRAATGMTLKESKDVVDVMAGQHSTPSPSIQSCSLDCIAGFKSLGYLPARRVEVPAPTAGEMVYVVTAKHNHHPLRVYTTKEAADFSVKTLIFGEKVVPYTLSL